MDIIIAVAAKIAEYTVAPVGRQLGYLFSYTSNVQNLTKQLQDLKNVEERMKHNVNNARNNSEEIHADVESWLSNVDEVSLEANAFLNLDDHAKVTCSCGSFPHLVTRHQLGRQAKKMSIRVLEAWERRNFERISFHPLPSTSASITTMQAGYQNFESRRNIMQKIMEAVSEARRSRIGLYGMGGIGKTMLAKEIARQAQNVNMVVMATISQTPNVNKIQQEIADRLHLDFNKIKTTGERADLLRQQLKPENGILLILDDLWKELDLEEIGIHNECRMLLTFRSRDVLPNYMGIAETNIFEIKPLDFEEAVGLFQKIIADIRVEQPYYKDVARKIVGECAGLPISIVTVAHALKSHMELYRWRDALKHLQSSTFTGIYGMDEKVYSSIRLSYDFLGSHEEAKSLLLLCALHKEDASIKVEDLMRYSYSFLQNINTVSEARDRVNSLVDKLKSHCLLLGDGRGNVKMHDVIRDVCISIAKEDEHRMYNITSATMYEKFVDDEKHTTSKVISFLGYDDYNKLPQKLEYPSLELLLMSRMSLESLPIDFFEQTRQLKALAMNCINLRSLSQSFHFVQNLQTLCLQGSYVEDIAVIGELKKLKVLDLSYSLSIELLPKEIGQLWRLQLLDLRHCMSLRIIEPNVISNLTHMEELYLPDNFKEWETEEDCIKERSNTNFEEIKSLQKLSGLYLFIPSANIVPQEIFSENLERYGIRIGDDSKKNTRNIFELLSFSRWLDLTLSTMDEINAFGLKSLITRSEYLSLHGLMEDTNIAPCFDEKVSFFTLEKLTINSCNNLKYLFSFSLAQNFVSLTEIKVRDCKSIEGIVVKVGEEEIQPRKILFPKLESLDLDKLSALQRICATDSCMEFPVLSYLAIKDCPKLKTFVSSPADDHQMKMILFPKLKSLVLIGLSDLQRFCATDSCMEFPLLSKLYIRDCPKLKTFISSPTTDLQEVNQLASTQCFFNEKTTFPNLKELTIWGCNNLKYLLSFANVRSLVQLETLNVGMCENIEKVIVGDMESCGSNAIIFEKLQTLELLSLPNIVKFCEGDCIECPLLSKLWIFNTPKIKEFISNSTGKRACIVSEEMGIVEVPEQTFFIDKVTSHNLKELATDWSEVVEEIFETKSSQSSLIFSNLSTLVVRYKSKDKAIAISDVKSFLHKYHNIHTLQLIGSFVDRHQEQQPGHGDGLRDGDGETCELTELIFNRCSRLESIESLSMSYHKLEILEIQDCDELTCLFTISTATTLLQLKEMKIINCSEMREVIITDYYDHDQPEHHPLVFHKLHTLKLKNLPNLKSFYSGNKVMSFPKLKELCVKKCPEMMTFSNGTITTDACLNTIDGIKNWEGDVNTTVRKYWEDLGLLRLFSNETEEEEE